VPEFDVVVPGGGTSGVLIASDLAQADRSVARRDEATGHLDDSMTAARLAESGVTLIRGTGQLTGPGVVEVGRTTGSRPGTAVLGYGDLVTATGAEPVAPPVEGLVDVSLWTSAEALSCPDLPRRRPRLAGLGLDRLGITPSAAGALGMDPACRVRAAGEPADRPVAQNALRVWAAGDVTGIASSAHTARYQAGIVADNILGRHRAADYRAIPAAVYTTPSVCCVGLTPHHAEPGNGLRMVGHDLAATARATVEDDDRGRIELYVDTSRGDMLVGAAAVGPCAEEWMGEMTLAIRAGLPLSVLADVVHAFPTYGEAIERSLHELAASTPEGDHR
jgi:pyruvate/2-oxoglutarate dehydrogenase complex dihydrolipoamide dehydrogenase (E3) component